MATRVTISLGNDDTTHGLLNFPHCLVDVSLAGARPRTTIPSIEDSGPKSRVPDAEGSTKHPLPGIANAGSADTVEF